MIRLAPGVELIQGQGGAPLLYAPSTGIYLRLSPIGVKVIRTLSECGGATEEKIAGLAGASNMAAISPFLSTLRQSGALEGGPLASTLLSRAVRRPTLRLPLWRPDRVFGFVLPPMVRRVAGIALTMWLLMAIAILLVLAAPTLAFLGPLETMTSVAGFVLVLVHMLLHEGCHVLAASYYGVKVREVGFGLLYFCIPVGYTDLTDSYRLHNGRQRAWIALAGPAFDISAAAATTLLALLAPVEATSVKLLLTAQITMTLLDLVILIPSDTYRALEALLGGLNFRGRAFQLLWSRVTRRPAPAHLKQLGPAARMGHLAYASLALPYTALQIAGIIAAVAR